MDTAGSSAQRDSPASSSSSSVPQLSPDSVSCRSSTPQAAAHGATGGQSVRAATPSAVASSTESFRTPESSGDASLSMTASPGLQAAEVPGIVPQCLSPAAASISSLEIQLSDSGSDSEASPARQQASLPERLSRVLLLA